MHNRPRSRETFSLRDRCIKGEDITDTAKRRCQRSNLRIQGRTTPQTRPKDIASAASSQGVFTWQTLFGLAKAWTRGQTSRDGLRTARCQTSRGTGSREALLPLLAFHVDGVQGIQHVALELPQSLRFSLHQQQLDRGPCGVVPCNNQPRAQRGTATIASIEAMKQSVHGPIEDDRSHCVVPQLPTQQLPRAQPHLLWTL